MTTEELIKLRNDKQLCWSCGRKAPFPRYMGSYYCRDHWEVMRRVGIVGLQILPEGEYVSE